MDQDRGMQARPSVVACCRLPVVLAVELGASLSKPNAGECTLCVHADSSSSQEVDSASFTNLTAALQYTVSRTNGGPGLWGGSPHAWGGHQSGSLPQQCMQTLGLCGLHSDASLLPVYAL